MSDRFRFVNNWILANKLLTICVLFTVFTMLDTIPILLGLWPPKDGIDAYIHLLGRLFLHSILVFGIYGYHFLKERVRSKVLVYLMVFFLSWGMLMVYLLINGLFVDLHPDAYVDASRSYAFMYLILGLILSVGSGVRQKMKARV